MFILPTFRFRYSNGEMKLDWKGSIFRSMYTTSYLALIRMHVCIPYPPRVSVGVVGVAQAGPTLLKMSGM